MSSGSSGIAAFNSKYRRDLFHISHTAVGISTSRCIVIFYLFIFSPSNRFLGKGSHGIVPKLLTKQVAMAFSEINSIEGIVLVTGC